MNKNYKHESDLIEAELEAIEADDDVDAPLPPHVRMTRGHNRSRTLQVRLNDDELDKLTERANGLGIPASTYARTLLLQGMDGQARTELQRLDATTPDTMKRIQRALKNNRFNLVMSAALAAEEAETGTVVQVGRRPAVKPRARRAASRSTGRKIAAARTAATGRTAPAKEAAAARRRATGTKEANL